MKLHSFATNRTLLSFEDGSEVFFSYETPVAGYSDKLGFVKTNQWYSSTTTRHINKYLNKSTRPDLISTVDQSTIDNMIGSKIPSRY